MAIVEDTCTVYTNSLDITKTEGKRSMDLTIAKGAEWSIEGHIDLRIHTETSSEIAGMEIEGSDRNTHLQRKQPPSTPMEVEDKRGSTTMECIIKSNTIVYS